MGSGSLLYGSLQRKAAMGELGIYISSTLAHWRREGVACDVHLGLRIYPSGVL